eukprot:08788.XXX_390026_390154_1 [CDS] Oithona nana genome sequencing.
MLLNLQTFCTDHELRIWTSFHPNFQCQRAWQIVWQKLLANEIP